MPLPKGYVLDKPQAGPKVPAGYVLDQPQTQAPPAAPTVTPTPGASISASPSWSQQLTDLLHHPLNALDNAAQPVSRPNNASFTDMAKADLDNIVSGAAGAIRHPINTVVGGVASMLNPKQTFDYLNQNGPQAGAQMIGNSLVMGPASKLAAAPLGRVAEAAGEKLQSRGGEMINKTVGSLQADFKHGANPGRAYIDAKLGPVATMQGFADKAKATTPQIGSQLGNIYKAGDKSGIRFPVQDVQSQLAQPIEELRAQQEGEGGAGASPELDAYLQRLQPAPNPAKVGAEGYTPSGLFQVKRNIAANTNWKNPTQFDLNAVRQENVGQIGGMLTDKFPEARPLNSQYQGLTNLGNRAAMRAATGSRPLTNLFGRVAEAGVGAALGSTHGPIGAAIGLGAPFLDIPVRSTIATGAGAAGRGMVAIGRGLQNLYGSR